MRPEWTESALCAQIGAAASDPWYPEKGGDAGATAKRICRRCPVIRECAQAALDGRERYGVWAGVAVAADCTAPTKLHRLAAGTAPEDVFTPMRGAA